MFKSRKFLTTLLALAGLTLGAVQAHADTVGNPHSTPYGYDAQHRVTLAGVPVGVPLDDVIPVCLATQTNPDALCHGPIGSGSWSGWGEEQVRIHGARHLMSFQGAPFKAEVFVSVDRQTNVIKGVFVDLSKIVEGGKLPFTAIVPMVQTFGTPEVADSSLPGMAWHPSDDQLVIMFDNELLLITPEAGSAH